MTTSSTSTPQPTVPSVQQESTFEEDYFAELLLDDDVDAELDSVVQPKKKSREERMNEAVEISKREYKYEHGITEQWWSLGLDRHPHHFERDRNVTGENWVDVVDLRVVESNIIQLYYQHKFARAYNLSLRLLCPSRYSGISAAQIPADIIPYDPGMELVWDKISREIGDMMMRAVVRTQTKEWGRVLADGTRRTWTQGSNGPTAELAAQCYALDRHFRDALVAISYAIVDRGFLRPFQRTLLGILTSWTSELAEAEGGALADIVQTMRGVAEYCVRSSGQADKPMFTAEDKVKNKEEDLSSSTVLLPEIPELGTEPEYVQRSSAKLGFTDEDELKVLDKAWKRVTGSLVPRSRGAGGPDDDEDGAQGGRSVRTL